MRKHFFNNSLFILLVGLIVPGQFLLQSCQSSGEGESSISKKAKESQFQLFSLIESTESGITFNNELEESDAVNTFAYLNAFNGGGVAVGDINNDDLPDIYFTGNLAKNQLYLNKGNLQFEDISKNAGVEGRNDWTSGVTMADVNNDGFLDIYVCRAYHPDPEYSRNLLYINNGDLTFTEQAKAYGVADESWSTQATFFDYDLDGDLDLYVANHLKVNNLDHDYSYKNFTNPVHELSDHLFKNNGDNTFTDVTVEAGILNYGVSLGIVSGDVNDDGYPDIFIANDQQEPDFLYLNNGDGTFKNAILEAFRHTSFFSMGVDCSDFNNDGQLDFMVNDMMAEDNYRQKTQMASMDVEGFWELVKDGYHYQTMRNVLQLNNGNGTFSEIGQMAGVSQTDWSWSALFADFDNDGLKDIFVSNGVKRDLLDKDFIKKLDKKLVDGYYEGNIDDLVAIMPSTPIANKLFRNEGDLTFSDRSEEFGIAVPGFSNGAAYSDLDLDGDLDLVINNINSNASLFKNTVNDKAGKNYLQVRLKGKENNLFGLGAKVTVTSGDLVQFQELTLTRGFKSSVDRNLHFGLGDQIQVDKVVVEWPGGGQSIMNDVAVNQVLEIEEVDVKTGMPDPWSKQYDFLFTDISDDIEVGFSHEENDYDDYYYETLLPHKTSQFGPKVAVGDVNGDGLEDFYIGGAAGQAGALFVQNGSNGFQESPGPWSEDKDSEDLGAVFFDADNDNDLDLYVASGGNEFRDGASPQLQDRLYLNNDGNFIRSSDALPEMLTSSGCVSAADYDKDGDMDLFIGGRLTPGKYPFAPRSYLLQNNNGKFQDVTTQVCQELESPGLVTSAIWTDFDQDNDLDLILAGEWMPISFFENNDGKLIDQTAAYGLENSTGWWNKIIAEDFDGDGDIDFVAGNLGLNYKYKASQEEPLHVYCSDFDNTGTFDIVLGYHEQGTIFPVRGRQCSSEQMPYIQEKFPTYKDFAEASIDEIYGKRDLKN
ncbi:MAG: hypothetical protein DWQ02_24845, partial [Bacteroidetes bacterium]